MDGGVRQEEMADQLKREVKEGSLRRRTEGHIHALDDRSSPLAPSGISLYDHSDAISNTQYDVFEHSIVAPSTPPQRGSDCTITCKDARAKIEFGRSETIFFTFYLDHVFPFLFPFYHPSILQGGKSWVLEMMLSSPVIRQAILCQSSYFFSLAQSTAQVDRAWETILAQTGHAFDMLSKALQIIQNASITEHLHGSVRIMASILQVQRFEIAVLNFNNCQSHLNAASTLFEQLLDSTCSSGYNETETSFQAVVNQLGPSTWILPAQCVQVSSAEQVAFRFSATLLIFDDIIASTVLQEEPRLYKYHYGLLGSALDTNPLIDVKAVVGCQNWVMLGIGEIAVLDAWKQQCKRAGNLDVMELVFRATAIKERFKEGFMLLETNPGNVTSTVNSLLGAFTSGQDEKAATLATQSILVTRVWAHAALLYLCVVVSGWQPASDDMRYHRGRIVELLSREISPSELLRTMVWPFCVAGCLAEPDQEVHFRHMAEQLQPPSVFGTVRKALEIMERVWRNRGAEDAANRDLASCFKGQGDMVLLV
jgi:hypothetical protein